MSRRTKKETNVNEGRQVSRGPTRDRHAALDDPVKIILSAAAQESADLSLQSRRSAD